MPPGGTLGARPTGLSAQRQPQRRGRDKMSRMITAPTGRIPVPALTVHGIDDPMAFVELDAAFRATMAAADTAGHLVKTFTADAEHSDLCDAAYTTLLAALLHWLESGVAPPRPASPSAAPRWRRRSTPAASFCLTTGWHRWPPGCQAGCGLDLHWISNTARSALSGKCRDQLIHFGDRRLYLGRRDIGRQRM